jgi:signal peptidase I
VREFTRGIIWLTGIFGALGVLLYLFVFDVWVVPRGQDAQFVASVVPTLIPEDKVLTRRGRVPAWGELARCASPLASGAYVVGRVFGTPGDRVEVTDISITTNGRSLAARHSCPQKVVPHPITDNLVTMQCSVAETGAWSFEYLTHGEMRGGIHSALVEAGKLYLVSDNRLMHQDSRDFGQVDASTCEHIVFRLWGERYTDSSRRFDILW